MKKLREERQVWSPDSEYIYARSRIEKAGRENQPTLRAFEEWLREERGLSAGTVTVRLGPALSWMRSRRVPVRRVPGRHSSHSRSLKG